MPQLLITADDFGLHKCVNAGIAECVEQGVVNSISVIASGKAPDFQLLQKFSKQGVYVGAHITWVGEEFMTEKMSIYDWKELCSKMLTGGRKFRYILRMEAEAQVQRLIDSGIQPVHIDSHQHVHHLPGLWSIIDDVRAKYNIPRIRVARVSDSSLRREGLGGLALQSMAAMRFREGEHYYCAGIRHAGNYLIDELIREVQISAGHNTEIVTHPGSNDAVLRERYPHWHFRWQEEMRALLDPRFKEAIDAAGFVLDRKGA